MLFMRAKTGIYFILAPSVNKVKIGVSDKIEQRLSNLQVGSPVKLELLLYFKADPHIENKLHERFCEYRSHGEWFEYAKPIKDIVLEISKNCEDIVLLDNTQGRFDGSPAMGMATVKSIYG